MNRWSIVQFVEDGTVEAVPSAWLADDFCYWPSLPHTRLTNAIKKCEPVNSSWQKHNVKLFSNGTFDDYTRARAKAKTAEDTSDLQSELEGGKRKRKQLISSDNSSDESDSILPLPPALKKKGKFVTYTNEKEEQIDMSTNSIIIESPETPQASPSENSTTEAYLKAILQQQHLLRSMLTDVLTRVENIENNLKQRPTALENKKSIFQLGILFPISIEQDFQKMETYLQDEENHKDAVKELAAIGGSNNYDFVKRAMTTMLTNNLAMTYSWLGKKGKKKFYTTKVAKVIIDAAETSQVAKDKKETEVSIQSWLRRATERNKVIAKDF